MVNLVVNARDAMPEGGELRLTTANVLVDDHRAGSELGLPPGEYVLLHVTDTGCGMTTDVQAHLFEPFFTTKPPGKGTGLGLATVYGIVTQTGGAITVDSAPGRGTTFTVYLPKATGPLTERLEHSHPSLRRGTETILLVEDEIGVRHLAAAILTRNGYTVVEAGTSDEAMRTYDTHAGAIDLLLTDVVMPGMNGALLAQTLRRRTPGLKVLWMSGYADHAVLERLTQSGESALLAKPFRAVQLVTAVRNALDARASETRPHETLTEPETGVS